MEIVDLFLNTLQNKIEANTIQITDFENIKNQKMQLKNILYSHEILDNIIKLEDLISFNNEEIKIIFNCLDNDKKDILFKTFNVYKPLVEMYEKIKNKYEGNFEAPQYIEASKWLNDIVTKINKYLNNSQSVNSEYIDSLKQETSLYSKYYNLFLGNELIKPITELKEFNTLLDKFNFNDHEQYELKKFIGISHIKLLSKEYNSAMSEDLEKYKVIIKSKKDKYNEIYHKILKENIPLENLDSLELSQKLNVSEYDIRQALTAILMENIINDIKNQKITVKNAILQLEDTLSYSHELVPENNQDEEIIEESSDDIILNEANEILDSEKELINSINEEEFSKYLAQSINENTEESTKYQIVSILLALHGELEKYNNVKEIEKVKDIVINNIKDYIDAYKTLKNKLNKK